MDRGIDSAACEAHDVGCNWVAGRWSGDVGVEGLFRIFKS
jgi:hypothetical protein